VRGAPRPREAIDEANADRSEILHDRHESYRTRAAIARTWNRAARPHVASVGETEMLVTVQSLLLWDRRSADVGDHRRAGG
jgi:hypothetical protein